MPPPRRPQDAAQSASGTVQKGAIVFFHPDLGIGGAERLVVDAAVGLQERGHRVVIFTNHCDPGHCFDECRDGTLDVRVRGNWLIPMSILSRLTILCAILRHIHLLLHIHLTGELSSLAPRAFVVDQLSAGLPLLRALRPAAPVLFYCHFPDLLLVQGRQASRLKRLYRVPFDRLEEWTMGFAQAVAVNSRFTRGVVAGTWPGLQERVPTRVVYPCVDTSAKEEDFGDQSIPVLDGYKILLSINRFERKKDIGLAIKAFAAIPKDELRGVKLIIAGGYDPRVAENVQYHAELQALASAHGLTHQTLTAPSSISPPATGDDASVLFLHSISGALKAALLRSARLLLYTPSGEHFGIVPLEAMLAGLPVLAADSGGPVETVLEGRTGWLRDPRDVPAWTGRMRHVLLDLPPDQAAAMGAEGARHVREVFGRDSMAQRLEATLAEIVDAERTRGKASAGFGGVLGLVAVGAVLILGILAGSLYASRGR